MIKPTSFFIIPLYIILTTVNDVQAQTILTEALNAPRPGDSLVMSRLPDIPQLPAGRDVVWDISQNSPGENRSLLFTGSDSLTVGTENGTSWCTVICGDTLLLTGFENRLCLMEYDRLLPLLRYPFSSGDSIKGQFHGMGTWCGRRFMRVWGDGITRAEGEGTLILPGGDTLRHVLMTRSVRHTYHITYDSIHTWDALRHAVARDSGGGLPDTAGIAPVITETRSWYAPGWRYPVLRADQSSDPLGSATLTLLYPPEAQQELDYDMENALARQSPEFWGNSHHTDNGDVHVLTSYSISADPSAMELTLHLTLSGPACVSLLLSDASGITWRSASQAFDNGGDKLLTVSYAGLPHGQYAVRISCGTDTFTEKFSVN